MACYTDRIYPLPAPCYDPIASNFQVTVSWWLPDRVTPTFGASVKIMPVVEHDVTSAVHVATTFDAVLLSVPVAAVAFDQVGAFQVTSLADHVVVAPGEVKLAALAWSDTRSCLAALDRTMLLTATGTAAAAVLDDTRVTLKVTAAGTETRACSLTFAVKIVDWDVSGNPTVV